MSVTIGVRNGDWDFDTYGSMVRVQGPDKCSQDLAEILLSTYNPATNRGTNITPGFVPPIGAKAFIAAELTQAVETLESLQHADTASTPDERIADIDTLTVTAMPDKTSFKYYLAVKTETGNIAYSSSRVQIRKMSFGQLSQGFSQGTQS